MAGDLNTHEKTGGHRGSRGGLRGPPAAVPSVACGQPVVDVGPSSKLDEISSRKLLTIESHGRPRVCHAGDAHLLFLKLQTN